MPLTTLWPGVANIHLTVSPTWIGSVAGSNTRAPPGALCVMGPTVTVCTWGPGVVVVVLPCVVVVVPGVVAVEVVVVVVTVVLVVPVGEMSCATTCATMDSTACSTIAASPFVAQPPFFSALVKAVPRFVLALLMQVESTGKFLVTALALQ